MMKKINKYKLEITVLVSGAIVMIFELVGSRILGPYLGSSIFIWTSLIGVILGSLSLGYYWGGKKADKKADMDSLSLIIFYAASFIALTTLLKGGLLLFLTNRIDDLRTVSVIGSIILFAPANVFLGMISPYVVKLKLKNLDISGETVGNLYALSAIGSIVGTFLAGFYLIPNFGTNKLLIILIFITVLLALFISSKKTLKERFLI